MTPEPRVVGPAVCPGRQRPPGWGTAMAQPSLCHMGAQGCRGHGTGHRALCTNTGEMLR